MCAGGTGFYGRWKVWVNQERQVIEVLTGGAAEDLIWCAPIADKNIFKRQKCNKRNKRKIVLRSNRDVLKFFVVVLLIDRWRH